MEDGNLFLATTCFLPGSPLGQLSLGGPRSTARQTSLFIYFDNPQDMMDRQASVDKKIRCAT